MPGFWRKCRIALRCVRFTVWAVLLLILGAFAWFNVEGLPNFLKTRLVTALQQRGVQLEFSRLRLRYYHGLVCDDVRIGAAKDTASPVLTAAQVQLRINYTALLHLRAQVDGLVVRQGKFTLPLTPQDSLQLTNLQGELRILPDDTWSLDHFRVDLAGATFNLAGEIAHAPECRNWKMFVSVPATNVATPPSRGSVQDSLKTFADTLKQIHFTGNPQLNLRLDGDARDVYSFTLTVSARAPAVQTPWFSLRNFEFASHVRAPTNTNAPPLSVGPAWAFWTNLAPFRVDWFARGTNFQTTDFQADALDCSGNWGESKDLHTPALTVNVLSRGLQTPWGSVGTADFAARVAPATNLPVNDPALSYWTNLEPFRLEWVARATALKSGQMEVDAIACTGDWISPKLTVTELSAHLGGGALETAATLDTAARALDFSMNSTFDPHTLAPLLPTETRWQLALISWGAPPRLRFGGTLPLPAWNHWGAGWQDEIAARAQLHGEAAVTNLLVTGAAVDSVQVDFACSNQLWNLPRLAVRQRGTTLDFSGGENDLTKDFHGRLEGQLEVESLRPFLALADAEPVLKLLTFRDPVALTLDAAGNLRDFTTLSATGRVTATHFAIRNQWIDRLTTTLSYSNWMGEFYQPQLSRSDGAENFTAERVTLDLQGQKLFLHAGQGHVSPVAVGEAIGPLTAAAMEPYHFPTIPDTTVDGCIPLKHDQNGDPINDDADLQVTLTGPAPFQWQQFATPRITGTIHWLANNLILTNVDSECYGGMAHGWGVFNLQTPGDGTDFSFFVQGTNVDFNAMGRALWSPTNQLRGALSGNVQITRANSSNWQTWNGYGNLQLQNGLLWNAPIFGRMSPVLNTLTPGLDVGNSRATDAAARFVMTNGVIFTDSLKIQSRTMQLDYVGTVDLQENVRARTRAQLLRNTPVLGELFSVVLTPVSKAFECDVTGTLDNPKITPAYLPWGHPIRTVEKIFSPTNGP